MTRRSVTSLALAALFSIISAVPAFARHEGDKAPVAATPEALICMQAAVSTREASLLSVLGTYNTATVSALTERKTALNTAWGIADKTQRKDARKAAWKTFNDSWKTAQKTMKTTRHDAWDTFKTASHACKVSTEGESFESQRAGF